MGRLLEMTLELGIEVQKELFRSVRFEESNVRIADNYQARCSF